MMRRKIVSVGRPKYVTYLQSDEHVSYYEKCAGMEMLRHGLLTMLEIDANVYCMLILEGSNKVGKSKCSH